MMKEKRGCFFPLNAIAVHPQGFRQFCLTSTLPVDSDPQHFEKQRWTIHQQLLAGEWPDTCRPCLNKEKRNLQSRRIRTWERKSSRYGEQVAQEMLTRQDRPLIRHLEISFSNVCNLQCAMCSSEFSTSWIADDKQAIAEGLEFRRFTEPFQKVARISRPLMDEILTHADEFDLVIVKGGEPTREPHCLEFLSRLAKLRAGRSPRVFIQSNGTRPPSEWMPALAGLELEIGFSLDGWGSIYEWIRRTSFSRVLEHFQELDRQPQVVAMTVDFTLSSFNTFHLPEFFEKMLELKSQTKKLNFCSVFQWVQQPYASPVNLRLEDRLEIAEKVRPLLAQDPQFFLNSDNLLSVLSQPRAGEDSRKMALKWHDFLVRKRGSEIYTLQPRLQESLT